jgi:hypothetical protein
MNTLYLKRNKLFSPIIFDGLHLTGNIVKLESSYGGNVTILDSFRFSLFASNCLYKQRIKRGNKFLSRIAFHGGIIIKENIIALLVNDKEGVKYLVLDKDFFEENKLEESRIKKNAQLNGVDIKKNIILGSQQEIFQEFSQLYVLSIEDWSKDKQKEVSKEFLQTLKDKKIHEVEEDEEINALLEEVD